MRRFRRRMSSPRPIIQSFKKVINVATISRPAGTQFDTAMSTGVDSVAAGQTSVSDGDVPTGCMIKFIEVQWAATNLVNISQFLSYGIQLVHAGQNPISLLVVGGNPQRNQVFYQRMEGLGQFQNFSRTIKFKIPKKFQRVREGDEWRFSRRGTQVFTEQLQVIYKFYR